jgi:alpha-D-xyloside xylohydrolase
MNDMLDLELPESSEDILWRVCKPISARVKDKAVVLGVPFQAQKRMNFVPDEETPRKNYDLIVRAYGDSIIRVSIGFGGELPDDDGNVMLEWDPSLKPEPLKVRKTESGWDILDTDDNVRMKIDTSDKPIKEWSKLIEAPTESFDATVFPDGKIAVPFMAWDIFFPKQMESISLGYIERRGETHRCLFSLHASADEKFAGTGERFARMNLAGKTFILENRDALGVNNRRAYKNVPFYVSSRPYGLIILTSAHVRLSLADISTRAAQALIEDNVLDLFFIGGGSIERIVRNYRMITGFPRNVPLWSYGTWMSRMTYFSADETREVARKLREGQFPCDVIHLDTGWFRTDWKCEWEFSPERFPDPEGYMKEMRDMGFRITLWQLPSVGKDTKHFETARENRYIAPKKASIPSGSNFGNVEYSSNIDFTNPEAAKWYQGLLENLLKMGAAAIKTDFGEEINMEADYYSVPAHLLHNLYCLLYQKAAFEITEMIKGEGIIWARAGWIGCQRYPVHWGGDSACTWDGLAASIRGGLHLGVSGFAFWSHDVPGFHGVPDFMNSWPDNDLYVRWTQVGVFTSHLRYHGTSPREPYEHPEIAPIVRKWLKLRYALIPYLVEEGNKAVKSGYPILRALIFHHENDPFCWNIDDQFYCGDNLLVAPILNPEGVRDVYLPEGRWTDIWTGEVIQGPVLLKNVESPLSQIPVYARTGSKIRVYPRVVQCTDEIDLSKAFYLVFDSDYEGLSKSILGEVTGLQ